MKKSTKNVDWNAIGHKIVYEGMEKVKTADKFKSDPIEKGEVHFELPEFLKNHALPSSDKKKKESLAMENGYLAKNRKKVHTEAQEAYYAKKSEACKKLKEEIANEKPIRGRPTLYSEELAEYICEKIASSAKSVKALCDEDEIMPDQCTVNLWCWKYPDFFVRYQLAKQHQAHWMAEHCEEIAKEVDYIVDQQGTQRVDPGFIASRRLMVDTKKWHASKLAPTVFGDRKAVEALQGENESIKAELMALKLQLAEVNKKEY